MCVVQRNFLHNRHRWNCLVKHLFTFFLLRFLVFDMDGLCFRLVFTGVMLSLSGHSNTYDRRTVTFTFLSSLDDCEIQWWVARWPAAAFFFFQNKREKTHTDCVDLCPGKLASSPSMCSFIYLKNVRNPADFCFSILTEIVKTNLVFYGFCVLSVIYSLDGNSLYELFSL